MSYDKLSVDELQAQLDEMEQSKAELEKALYQRWHEAKSGLAQQIKEMIESQGYEIEEIFDLVMPKRRRATAGPSKKSGRAYTRYVDPENPNNLYVRGVLPGWMKSKMTEQGYDPSVKEDREAFKSSYLQAVTD